MKLITLAFAILGVGVATIAQAGPRIVPISRNYTNHIVNAQYVTVPPFPTQQPPPPSCHQVCWAGRCTVVCN